MAININKEKFSDAYIEQDLGKSGKAFVDLFNGNLTFVHTDVQFNYGNPIISVGHVYSAKSQTNGAYGNNWSLNCDEKVVRPQYYSTLYCYDASGRVECFYPVKDNVANRIKEMHNIEMEYATVCQNIMGTKTIIYNSNSLSTEALIMIDEKGNKKYFNSLIPLLNADRQYYLTKVEMANGNTLTYTRNGNNCVTQILDNYGSYVNFTYSNGKLSKIEDNAGRKKKFTYSGGNLISIDYLFEDNTTENCLKFEYNSNNLITRVIGENGISYLYEYLESGRVSNVTRQTAYEQIGYNAVIALSEGTYNSFESWAISYNLDGCGVEENKEYDAKDFAPDYINTKVTTNLDTVYYYAFKSENGVYYYNSLFYEGNKNKIGVAKDEMSIRTSQSGERILVSTAKDNLLKNPNFDNTVGTGNRPMDWQGFYTGTTENYISYDAMDNTNSLLISADGREHNIYQKINNEIETNSLGEEYNTLNGGIYTLCAWVKGGRESTKKEFALKVKYYNCSEEVILLSRNENIARLNVENSWVCVFRSVFIPGTKTDSNGVNQKIESIKVCVNFSSTYTGADKDLLIDRVLLNCGRINTIKQEPVIVCKTSNDELIYKFDDVDYSNTDMATWLQQQMFNNANFTVSKIRFLDGNQFEIKDVRVIYNGGKIFENSDFVSKTENDSKSDPIRQYVWNRSNNKDNISQAFQILSEYDKYHRLTKQTDYRDIKQEITYSDNNEIPETITAKIYYNDSYKMQKSITKTNNGYAVEIETDELGQTTRYVYNTGTDTPFAKDKLYMVIYPDQSYCRYEYDNIDRISKIATGTKSVDENNNDVFTDEHYYIYEYTLGLLTKVTTDTSDVYTYYYNGLNQILKIQRNDEELVSYSYHVTYGENYENYQNTIKYGKTYRTYFNKYNQPIRVCTYDMENQEQETILTEMTYNDNTKDCKQITDTVQSTILSGNTTWTVDSSRDKNSIEANGVINYKYKDRLQSNKLIESERETENATLYTKYNYAKHETKGLYPDNRLSGFELKGKTKVTTRNNVTNEESVTNGLSYLGKLTYTYNLLQQQTSDVMQLDENAGYHNVYRTNRTFKNMNGYTSNVITGWNNYATPKNSYNATAFENSYTYDTAGNIISNFRKDNLMEVNGSVINRRLRYNYKYDGVGKLIREDDPYFNESITYEYDTRGNIIKKRVYSYSNNGELQGTPVETVYTYDDKNRMLTIGDFECAYDEYGRPSKIDYLYNIRWDGNQMIRCSNKSFAYDNRGYMVKARYGGVIQNFTYDLNGNLVEEKINDYNNIETVTYFYNDRNEVLGFTLKKITSTTNSETNETVTTEEDYPYYYIKDMQGNVCHIVDKDSKIVVSYYYDAWGRMFPESNSEYEIDLGNGREYNANHISSFNRFYYRSYFLDYDTGLYYLKSRFYDPKTGRFISPDEAKYLDVQIPYGTNLYAYCANNPVMYVDPEGSSITVALLIIGAIVGVAVGVGVAVYNDYQDDAEVNGSIGWYNYVGAGIIGGIIGAGATGLAIGAVGAIYGGIAGINAAFLGTTAAKAVAIGLLAYNSMAVIVGPILGVSFELIGMINQEDQYKLPKPNETPKHPADKISLSNLTKQFIK